MDTKGIGDDIAFLGQPLTPSLLVRTANPRHDRAGARNAIVIRGGSRPRDSRICYARTMPGVRLMQHPKGEYARARLWGVSSSRHQCRSLARPRKPNRGTEMNNSPYLDRPLFPLAVALPRMLEKIEAELVAAGPAKTRRLRPRAELIRGLRSLRRRSPPPS